MNDNVAIDPDVRNSWQVPDYEKIYWHGKTKKYCVVIPVINEGKRIQQLLVSMCAANIPSFADIIIIDGGSTDDSLKIEFLQSQGVQGLLLKTGKGKLSTQLRCAYAFALDHGYEGIVTIDGNNKDDPKDITCFIKALENGVDFVQASRYIDGGVDENTPLSRTLAIRYLHAPLLSLCSGFHWTDTTQGFRAYSRRLLLSQQMAVFRDVFSEYELLAYLSYRAPRLKYNCMEMPATRRYPATGETPTKISAISGNVTIFKTLVMACLGLFNP